MYLKYQIRNNFQTITGTSITVDGNVNVTSKSITIPINMDFFPVDYGDDLQDIVFNERGKAINPVFDAETTKYTYDGFKIQFKFWNPELSIYTSSYLQSGFSFEDINLNKNGFKKSFFRLNFYYTNSGDTNSLIFTEDLNVTGGQSIIDFNRLYWLRNDPYFVENNNNKTVYMDARFFNAKTGKIQRFINTPQSVTTPITINQYSDPNNRDWRQSAVILKNPRLYNGQYNFMPYVPFGSNTSSLITLSEFIMV
jgi:hypothetical protein